MSTAGRPQTLVPEDQLRDPYIWAEICYLDSPLDYRDYLPGKTSPDSDAFGEPLVFLDTDSGCPLWSSFIEAFLSLVAAVFVLVILSVGLSG